VLREGTLLAMSQRTDHEQELVTCDGYGRLLFWDCDVRDPVQVIDDPYRMPLRCVSVSPTGKYLAYSGDDGLVKVVDLVTGEIVAIGIGHSNVVRAVQWSPDERQLISTGDDAAICVWNFFAM
jgi:WD40 repeat protein